MELSRRSNKINCSRQQKGLDSDKIGDDAISQPAYEFSFPVSTVGFNLRFAQRDRGSHAHSITVARQHITQITNREHFSVSAATVANPTDARELYYSLANQSFRTIFV